MNKMSTDFRNTIHNLLSKGKRLSARPLDGFRNVVVEYDVTRNAEGSARVKIGDTEVMAGVKLEVGTPYPDTPDQGGIMVNVELLPLSNPEFEPGPPGIDAIELSRVTDRGIRESKAIDVKKLCIAPGEKAWTVIIDVVTINYDGNLFDAIALAAMAALKDTKFPEYKDGTIDYKKKTDKSLPLEKTPIAVTVYKYGDALLIDPDFDEDKAYDSRLSVAVMENGELCSLQKGGAGAISVDGVNDMIQLAIKKSGELRKHL